MTENLIATQQAAKLSKEQVIQLAVNAFEGSWLSQPEKNGLRQKLEDYIKG